MYEKIDSYIDRLIDESRPDAPMWNIESIRKGKKPHWNYIDGCMITAFLEIARITGNERYFELYGVHKEDMNNYDLVVDTSTLRPEEVANEIIDNYKKWLEK